jgi:SnoaL-like domain
MRDVFTEDAVWDGGERFGVYEGFDAVYAFFAGVSGQITWALHYMVAPVVQVADDLESATATWYLLEPCTLDGQAVWLMGNYRDEYRREDGRWKISRLEIRFQTVTPHEEGWARRPFVGE